MTQDALLAEALALPREARAKLLCKLMDSLDESPAAEEEARWVAEINRRLALYRKGELKAVPMELAIAELRAEFPD
jgi:putative addiction module component (TIGR02574 family)